MNKPDNRQLKPEQIDRLLEVSYKELEVQEKNLVIQNENNKLQYQYAKESLHLQAEDLKHQREHETKLATKKHRYVVILLSIILVFVGLMFFLGFSEKIIQLFKDFYPVAISFITGYFYGKSKSKATTPTNND